MKKLLVTVILWASILISPCTSMAKNGNRKPNSDNMLCEYAVLTMMDKGGAHLWRVEETKILTSDEGEGTGEFGLEKARDLIIGAGGGEAFVDSFKNRSKNGAKVEPLVRVHIGETKFIALSDLTNEASRILVSCRSFRHELK